MHVGVERVKEANAQTLKSEFEVIYMKDSELIDDFVMKLTMIVSGIHLGNMVEEISVVKKFLRAVLPRFMQIVTFIEQFSDLKNMPVEEVVSRFKVERLCGYEDKRRKNTSYSHIRSDSHGRKRMMWLTLLFKVRRDVAVIQRKTEVVEVAAITRKTEVVDVVAGMAVDMVAEEA